VNNEKFGDSISIVCEVLIEQKVKKERNTEPVQNLVLQENDEEKSAILENIKYEASKGINLIDNLINNFEVDEPDELEENEESDMLKIDNYNQNNQEDIESTNLMNSIILNK
jgi:hypothetical protein